MRALLVLPLALFAALAVAQTSTVPFAAAALLGFDAWDANHDGALDAKEVTHAVLDPRYHGEQAAALGALHVWQGNAGAGAPSVTKAWLAAYRSGPLPTVPTGGAYAEAKAAKKTRAASPYTLQKNYAADLKRIQRAPKELFADEGPSYEEIKQGALGNCYMLAPLGAIAHRNPNDVRSMIKPSGSGYAVTFLDGKTVQVASPTDAEIGMGGSSLKSGLWIRVVEKAFGSRNIPLNALNDDVARDNLNGGNTPRAGLAYTGHKFTGPRLVGDYKKEAPDTTVEPLLETIRKDVPKAIAEGRIVMASTGTRGVPTSITPNHAYAVFAFDASTDRITLWNPHGDGFKPKGEEGFEYGYRREDGVFTMPLKDFVHAFERIMIEQPAK